ncbi:MAG: hypothetical protein ACPGJV_02155 [Bacteriovoracaceae bacterium]
MKLLILLSFLLPFFALSKEKKKLYFGTPKRLEFEYKFASTINPKQNLDIKAIISRFKSELERLINKEVFHFPKLSKKSYWQDLQFTSFVFQDHYLDTDSLAVFNANSVYRLRHRWVHTEKFYRHQILPFLRVFYPDRCEIQFKSGYIRNEEDKTVKVFETRFEFRKESEPFLSNGGTPPPPWPVKEYLEYAKSGEYKIFPMLPFYELEATIGKNEVAQIAPKLKVTTERHRTHLNMDHLWGVGPNPQHVFILTLDLSRVQNLQTGESLKETFLELEIEIDRNTSTEINRIADLKEFRSAMEEKASETSKEAQGLLKLDLKLLRKSFEKILNEEFQLTQDPTNNKYSRFITLFKKS